MTDTPSDRWDFRIGRPSKKTRKGERTQKVIRSKQKRVKILTQKVGRNDPCTCGSGKKYKKCCGG